MGRKREQNRTIHHRRGCYSCTMVLMGSRRRWLVMLTALALLSAYFLFATPNHQEPLRSTYTNGLMHVRVFTRANGHRLVQVTNDHVGEVRNLYSGESSTELTDRDVTAIIRSHDVVIVDWAGVMTDLHRLDVGKARDYWRELCSRATEGRASFQRAIDARRMQSPVFFWFALANELPPGKRYDAFEMHMHWMGIELSCPSLKELWASAEQRLTAARDVGCEADGRLTRRGDQCVASTDDDCLVSRVCTSSGQCSAQGDRCVATAGQCEKSLVCGLQGRCTLDEGRCAPGPGTEDCGRSFLCAQSGACSRSATTGRCSVSFRQGCVTA